MLFPTLFVIQVDAGGAEGATGFYAIPAPATVLAAFRIDVGRVPSTSDTESIKRLRRRHQGFVLGQGDANYRLTLIPSALNFAARSIIHVISPHHRVHD